jgi:hypothetical protein
MDPFRESDWKISDKEVLSQLGLDFRKSAPISLGEASITWMDRR